MKHGRGQVGELDQAALLRRPRRQGPAGGRPRRGHDEDRRRGLVLQVAHPGQHDRRIAREAVHEVADRAGVRRVGRDEVDVAARDQLGGGRPSGAAAPSVGPGPVCLHPPVRVRRPEGGERVVGRHAPRRGK
ncbi:hypothetical protein [Ornithinimicrobium kibberense]|uniref:hypothetical protein n=1 Tax=Ornithinimicrobium kibberense TaxID=282060 RepID=UPI0036063D78